MRAQRRAGCDKCSGKRCRGYSPATGATASPQNPCTLMRSFFTILFCTAPALASLVADRAAGEDLAPRACGEQSRMAPSSKGPHLAESEQTSRQERERGRSANAHQCQEVGDIFALVALDLDDLAHVVVLDDSAVAAVLLLQLLQDLLVVEALFDALRRSLPATYTHWSPPRRHEITPRARPSHLLRARRRPPGSRAHAPAPWSATCARSAAGSGCARSPCCSHSRSR